MRDDRWPSPDPSQAAVAEAEEPGDQDGFCLFQGWLTGIRRVQSYATHWFYRRPAVMNPYYQLGMPANRPQTLRKKTRGRLPVTLSQLAHSSGAGGSGVGFHPRSI